MAGKESWKNVKGYNGDYQISNQGRILTHKNPNNSFILKQHKNHNGYYVVTLSDNGNLKTHFVHDLVGKHFNDDYDKKLQCNHIDGDKENNYSSNLEWLTSKENHQHAIKKGLRNIHPARYISNNKINSQDVLEIRVLYKLTDKTQSELSEIYGVGQDQISRIVNNKRWKHVSR